LLLPSDHRESFAEIALRVSRIVAQWREHLAQPLEDSFRGVVLLGRLTLILLQDPVNDAEEWIQLGSCRWPAPPISWRHENVSIFATVRGSIPKRRAASR